jgi:hypothetical protein
MAATLVATTLLFAALLPLARPDQRDIPLPSFGTDIELSAPAPIPPTTAPRRPTRGPAIRRAETVSPIPSTENETRNSAETYAALEAAPATIAEFEWEPATEPLASQLTISGEWLIAPGLTAPAMPRAGAASGPAEASFDPGLFRGMYLTFGLLQGADVFSTIVAVKSGAREANPLMRVLADSPAPLIAVKGHRNRSDRLPDRADTKAEPGSGGSDTGGNRLGLWRRGDAQCPGDQASPGDICPQGPVTLPRHHLDPQSVSAGIDALLKGRGA